MVKIGGATLEDVSPFFHLPIEEAARELGVCSSALKRRCRRLGIKRWPFRKVRSMSNSLSRTMEDMSLVGATGMMPSAYIDPRAATRLAAQMAAANLIQKDQTRQQQQATGGAIQPPQYPPPAGPEPGATPRAPFEPQEGLRMLLGVLHEQRQQHSRRQQHNRNSAGNSRFQASPPAPIPDPQVAAALVPGWSPPPNAVPAMSTPAPPPNVASGRTTTSPPPAAIASGHATGTPSAVPSAHAVPPPPPTARRGSESVLIHTAQHKPGRFSPAPTAPVQGQPGQAGPSTSCPRAAPSHSFSAVGPIPQRPRTSLPALARTAGAARGAAVTAAASVAAPAHVHTTHKGHPATMQHCQHVGVAFSPSRSVSHSPAHGVAHSPYISASCSMPPTLIHANRGQIGSGPLVLPPGFNTPSHHHLSASPQHQTHHGASPHTNCACGSHTPRNGYATNYPAPVAMTPSPVHHQHHQHQVRILPHINSLNSDGCSSFLHVQANNTEAVQDRQNHHHHHHHHHLLSTPRADAATVHHGHTPHSQPDASNITCASPSLSVSHAAAPVAHPQPARPVGSTSVGARPTTPSAALSDSLLCHSSFSDGAGGELAEDAGCAWKGAAGTTQAHSGSGRKIGSVFEEGERKEKGEEGEDGMEWESGGDGHASPPAKPSSYEMLDVEVSSPLKDNQKEGEGGQEGHVVCTDGGHGERQQDNRMVAEDNKHHGMPPPASRSPVLAGGQRSTRKLEDIGLGSSGAPLKHPKLAQLAVPAYHPRGTFTRSPQVSVQCSDELLLNLPLLLSPSGSKLVPLSPLGRSPLSLSGAHNRIQIPSQLRLSHRPAMSPLGVPMSPSMKGVQLGGAFSLSPSEKGAHGNCFSLSPSVKGTLGNCFSLSPSVKGTQGDCFSLSPSVRGFQVGSTSSLSPSVKGTQGASCSFSLSPSVKGAPCSFSLSPSVRGGGNPSASLAKEDMDPLPDMRLWYTDDWGGGTSYSTSIGGDNDLSLLKGSRGGQDALTLRGGADSPSSSFDLRRSVSPFRMLHGDWDSSNTTTTNGGTVALSPSTKRFLQDQGVLEAYPGAAQEQQQQGVGAKGTGSPRYTSVPGSRLTLKSFSFAPEEGECVAVGSQQYELLKEQCMMPVKRGLEYGGPVTVVDGPGGGRIVSTSDVCPMLDAKAVH